MPFPNFHTCRVHSPRDFVSSSFRTTTIAPGIELISGRLKSGGTSMVAQSYHFDKSKFSYEEMKAWAVRHHLSPLETTEATGA
jgi:hypothetical protein